MLRSVPMVLVRALRKGASEWTRHREPSSLAKLGVSSVTSQRAPRQAAWYFATKAEFLADSSETIANHLAGRAAEESLQIEAAQSVEWQHSVGILQASLGERIAVLRTALTSPGCEAVRSVILEFDFKRRGLRMDCLLLADGVLFVIEFKRSRLQSADRDQVMNYAINLIEFHGKTQEWCDSKKAIVVPVLTLTGGEPPVQPIWPGLKNKSWPALADRPIECGKDTLHVALALGVQHRRSTEVIGGSEWLASPFMPSSSILDATLSLFGNHDVAAIQAHAAPKEAIEASTREIREHIDSALSTGSYHIVFLSGAPGAGKTLVGLDLVMRGSHAGESVFVTGNAPLVEVLNKALSASYRAQGRGATPWAPTGYRRSDSKFVAEAATFKIVKAHNFLGERGQTHRQGDGRVLVFDEAQRTYESGRIVLGKPLPDHEADLILSVQRKAFPTGGAVVVALLGHNQAINRGERGIVAWLEAAQRQGWSYSISDETLKLAEFHGPEAWGAHPSRRGLQHGHLHQSMRYYRNAAVEAWAGAVLSGDVQAALQLSQQLDANGASIWITRSLDVARDWAKPYGVGSQKIGLIASGQARRLAAHGLFVDHKPDIEAWMLAPSGDIRSSNALETVQNQYQIQGLELDYSIVCWDADLRRVDGRWVAFKLSGDRWQNDALIDVALNSYRVLLTRARKGMTIFVPQGDLSGADITRRAAFYDDVAEFLMACGARELPR